MCIMGYNWVKKSTNVSLKVLCDAMSHFKAPMCWLEGDLLAVMEWNIHGYALIETKKPAVLLPF